MDNVLPRPLECLLEIRRLINSSIQPRLSMISFRIIFNLTKIPAPFLRSRYSDLSIRKASDIYIYLLYIPFDLPFQTPFSHLSPFSIPIFPPIFRTSRVSSVSQPPHSSSLVITKSRPAREPSLSPCPRLTSFSPSV